MSTTEDVRETLVNAGVVEGATGWKCFIGFLPTSPDKCIVIYETGGQIPEDRFTQRYFSIQVRGRGAFKGLEDLRAKMEQVYQTLHTGDIDNPVTSPDNLYVLCNAIQSAPLALGEDENKRPGLTLNFRIIANR